MLITSTLGELSQLSKNQDTLGPSEQTLQKIVSFIFKIKILTFFLLFFQRTPLQLSEDRVCLLTAYGYAKLKDGLTDYLLLLSKDKF